MGKKKENIKLCDLEPSKGAKGGRWPDLRWYPQRRRRAEALLFWQDGDLYD